MKEILNLKEKTRDGASCMGIDGNRIKLLRKSSNIRQVDLAESCLVGRSMIANVETGYADPSEMLLISIAEVFKVPVAYIQGEAEYPVRNQSLELKDFYIKEKRFVCPICNDKFQAAVHYGEKEACFKCFRAAVEGVKL